MKCIIKLGFWRKYKVNFTTCQDLEEVRKFLNGEGAGLQPFFSIGNKCIIRMDAIKKVVANKKDWKL